MADQVEAFRNDLQERVWAAPADTRPEAVVLANLDCNWDQRFGHPVVRDAAAQVVAAVARTYNPAEQFFSQAKRKLRRRLGRTHLGQDMQDQPAEAALAANLLDPRYVRIVCGTLDDLLGWSGLFRQLGGEIKVESAAPLPSPSAKSY